MPSAAAIIGLTFKGTDIQDLPRVFLQVISGGPDSSPETRGEDSTTPYRAGMTYGPRRANRLPIMLEGWVAGEGETPTEQAADTASARHEMYLLFDVEGGPGELLATTEDGAHWSISAYPEAYVPESLPPVPGFIPVSVRLIATDPPSWQAEAS